MDILAGKTTIQDAISDHKPLHHNGILSFNMMMQGKLNREKKRYNNAFGFEEDNARYQARIKMTVRLLAEAAHLNPNIYAIGLTEAPIKPEDIKLFITEAKKYPSLKRFCSALHPSLFTSMGLVTLIDSERFDLSIKTIDQESLPNCLENRVQKFVLTERSAPQRSFELYNLHLPFDLAKGNAPGLLRSFIQSLFKGNLPCIVMGDFNMDPRNINLSEITRHVIPNNNVLAIMDESGRVAGQEYDTVDAIFYRQFDHLPYSRECLSLSSYYLGLMYGLKEEKDKDKARLYLENT